MKPKLNQARIEACEKILRAFQGASVIVIKQVSDGTVGECLHNDGIREFMFVPIQECGQNFVIKQISRKNGRKENQYGN